MSGGGRRAGRVVLLLRHTTYRASAFLDAAEALGVPVTVASDCAQALATWNPDAHLVFDFARPGEAVERVLAFAREHPVDAVLAADDDGVPVAAEAAAALGLPHHPPAAVRAARSKLATRERLAAAGLPGPVFGAFPLDEDPARVARGVRFPCVVKPLALSASRGVIRADDPAALAAAWARTAAIVRAAPSEWRPPGTGDHLLVEDYMPGDELAVEGLVTDGRLAALAVFDKPDPLTGPFFEETLYVTPSRRPAGEVQALVAETQAAVAALGLAHGPVHAEARWTPRGPVLLEIAPRSIGGLCARALRFTGGQSLESLVLRHALGEDVTRVARESGASGVLMVPIPRAGVLRGVAGVEEARLVAGVDDVRIMTAPGERLVPPPEGGRYLGFVFARAAEPELVEAALREALARLRFDIEEARPAAADNGSRAARSEALR
jgi:biotin carboxylase